MDETGFQMDDSPRYTFTKKGAKDVNILNSGHRDHVTVVTTVCANGNKLPPFFIFAGMSDKAKENTKEIPVPSGASQGAVSFMTKSGFINEVVWESLGAIFHREYPFCRRKKWKEHSFNYGWMQ